MGVKKSMGVWKYESVEVSFIFIMYIATKIYFQRSAFSVPL